MSKWMPGRVTGQVVDTNDLDLCYKLFRKFSPNRNLDGASPEYNLRLSLPEEVVQ